jgi:membrane associated rhomboid family serine protease
VFPLKDDIPSRSFPFVTVGLIVINVLVFFYQVSLGLGGPAAAAHEFIAEFGLIPCRLTGQCVDALAGLPSPYATIFTSMFLHGGLFHVAGNMLYLWIFGDNVEDTLGHMRFSIFYFLSGVAAALAQTVVGPGSPIPMVGASGAVSGVLGAYLILYPHARILTLLVIGFFVRLVYIPALVVLGFWIVVQFFSGFLTLGLATGKPERRSPSAWAASSRAWSCSSWSAHAAIRGGRSFGAADSSAILSALPSDRRGLDRDSPRRGDGHESSHHGRRIRDPTASPHHPHPQAARARGQRADHGAHRPVAEAPRLHRSARAPLLPPRDHPAR